MKRWIGTLLLGTALVLQAGCDEYGISVAVPGLDNFFGPPPAYVATDAYVTTDAYVIEPVCCAPYNEVYVDAYYTDPYYVEDGYYWP